MLGGAFDVVFVETVGVGQSESDVADLVDTLVFVTQPGAGDLLQFMKAGVLELPDVFVVNKADQGALAERTARELEAGLGLGERARRAGLATAAWCWSRRATGAASTRCSRPSTRTRAAPRERRARASAGCAARDRFVLERSRPLRLLRPRRASAARRALADRLAGEPAASGFALAERLGREIEEALRK